jgi:quinol monooxygenase YgiN
LSQTDNDDATPGGRRVTSGTTCHASPVVLELADFAIVPAQEDAFVAAYREAVPLVLASPGCRSVRLTRGIESPSRFVLQVEWDDLEAHTVGFRESERFPRWRAAVGPFFDGAPQVEHFTDVASAVPEQ